MEAELIRSWAAILSALAWPTAALIISILLVILVLYVIKRDGRLHLKFKEAEVLVEPAQGLRPPSASPGEDQSQLTKNVEKTPQAIRETLPFDYFFLNHTSFLRKEKQDEFRKRTGVPLDHYDIRVIIDSYYRGALNRIEYVEYILHRAYPQPIQYRRNLEDKFMLKELANGEYVLMAKVYLKDRKEPLLLQRYITLWETGPRLA